MPPTWGRGGKSWRDPVEGPSSLPCPCTLGIFQCLLCVLDMYCTLVELAIYTRVSVAVACMTKLGFCEVWVDGCKRANMGLQFAKEIGLVVWCALSSCIFV